MATSRVSVSTSLSSSRNDRRQVQARIRALQQRANALQEELSRSSVNTDTAAQELQQVYFKIINDFEDQRDQLLRRLHNAKQNIRQSANELNGIRKNLNSAQSFHLQQSSPRQSTILETQEMNAMVDDIERSLADIAQKLKQYHFKPTSGHAIGKKLGTIQTNKPAHNNKDNRLHSRESSVYSFTTKAAISIHKLYTTDLDISAQWIVASLEDRIFISDSEGEVRIFSYSRSRRRQPLLTERFHLSVVRLISSFTVTEDYIVAFESDTQMLTLHTHHGALMVRLGFPYDPIMIVRCFYGNRNQIWTCSRSKRQCYQISLDHTKKDVRTNEQLDFQYPVANILIDPVGISNDEHHRLAVHDVNPTTSDRLLLFTNHQNSIIQLDLIKYADRQLTSRVERVLLVPHQSNLIVLVYTPQANINNLREIVVVDIEVQPAEVLYRFAEANGIENLDLTAHGEMVYSVTAPANKRIPPKMHIYSLTT